MDIITKTDDTTIIKVRPYSNELAYNIQQALPDAKVKIDRQNIYLYLYGDEQPNLKQSLYALLHILPEIDHPLERISFVLYWNDSMEDIVLINPSENDARALEFAIERCLQFSGEADSSWFKPMPLDHPYYKKK
jgi:hypothetical protein